jgi:hypothetical protein
VDALTWAESVGARVTNNSNVYGIQSSAIASKYAATRDAGMVHFASAGNNGLPQLSYPASLSSVMAVAAIDRFGNRAPFSNYGSGIDYTAPGDDIIAADRTGADGYAAGDYAVVEGTSFSSPYAAGVAALLLSIYPGLDAADVETILILTSTDLGSPGKDAQFGWGLVNAYNTVLFDACEVDAATANPSGLESNRYMSFVAGDAWFPYAIRLEMAELVRPSPPNPGCCPPPDFSAYEGQHRWVGPITTCPDSVSGGTNFYCATLQCTPHYADWRALLGNSVLYVSGPEIAPSSLYRLQGVASGCDAYSSPLEVRTARWADVTAPFQDRNWPLINQPNAMDIAAIVDKVKALPGSLTKTRAQLQPANVNPQAPVSAMDIGFAVSAVKGQAYSFSGPTACP